MFEFSTGLHYPYNIHDFSVVGAGSWVASDRDAIAELMRDMQRATPALHPIAFHAYPSNSRGTLRLQHFLSRSLRPCDYDYMFLACVYHQLGYVGEGGRLTAAQQPAP